MFGATTVTVWPVWSPSVTRHMFLCLRLIASCTNFHFRMVRFAHGGNARPRVKLHHRHVRAIPNANFSYEAMTAVIVQFLQRNAQLWAGVAVTHGKRSCGHGDWRPDKEGPMESWQTSCCDRTHTHTKCFTCGRIALVTWPKIVGSKKGGSWNREPSTCEKDEKGIYSVFSGTTSLSNLETHSEKR